MAGKGNDPILALVGQTYDAALDQSLWAELVPEIGRTFQSPSCTVHLIHPRSTGVTFLGCTENISKNMDSYTAHHHSIDLWAAGAQRAGLGTIVTGEELISDRDFIRTEFFNDWCRAADQRYFVGAVLNLGNDRGAVGIHRPPDGDEYTTEDKRRVSAFIPHLKRALLIRQQLGDAVLERQASLDALQRTATATLVVTKEGRILYANARAESLLRQGDAIRGIAGRLVTVDRVSSGKLAMAIGRAAEGAAGESAPVSPTLVIAREDRLPLTLMVAPMRPARDGLGGTAPAVMVFVRDPELPTPSVEALRGLFGLTAAEASIAAGLANGLSIEAIAASHRISLNTARTHLKRALAKTGTRRQAELVALLLRSVATMASGPG